MALPRPPSQGEAPKPGHQLCLGQGVQQLSTKDEGGLESAGGGDVEKAFLSGGWSNLFQARSNGLQPNSDGLQPKSEMASHLLAMASNLLAMQMVKLPGSRRGACPRP